MDEKPEEPFTKILGLGGQGFKQKKKIGQGVVGCSVC